ncbi:MAG: 1-(5-phosphoribosyl)-5-[(5-phosphoribosylamino)methylideneamino]imidazole-4-carboxamide isomerase [Deltaproteobacteria bacterium]|nr:1-(5-phosphoribosyl)-5-[(5-phosphoribosylamino)methylideneamino]imidazole-4-carboxamide isomerase [Deltaproteobacteria bacterium]MBW2071277.1 1-(5-phosphoribosyl)-5-[(5-phosphoribosylamino)methylideneamino]imidazole-4-carboxamide isomerase [Deltaproteobacteria bacterium]
MKIIPAIDLKNGQCVRLAQGDMATATVYSDDPVRTAVRWQQQGAELLHLVDLDGAFEKNPRNRDALSAIVRQINIPVQVGGGIRTLDTVAAYMDLGVARVILATAAHKNPKLLEKACQHFPGRIVLGIDSRQGRVAVEGWSETTSIDPISLARRFESLELAAIVYTDILRDGMESGPNIDATRELARAINVPVIASGGVGSIEDIRKLRTIEKDGVVGVIIGRALYSGKMTLGEALEVAGAKSSSEGANLMADD